MGRIRSLDAIRSLAIVAVVSIHVMQVPALVHGQVMWMRVLVESTAKIGVPLFLMLTGYLMLGRDYSGGRLKRFLTRNWLPMLVAFESWAAISFAVQRLVPVASVMPDVVRGAPGLRGLAQTMLFWGEPFMVHFWYMQLAIGLYLLIPVLSAFLRQIDRDGNRWYLHLLMGALLLYCFALPTMQAAIGWLGHRFDAQSRLGGFAGLAGQGVMYFLAGYLIRTGVRPRWLTQPARWALLAASLAFLWACAAAQYHFAHASTFRVTDGYLPILLTAACLFLAMADSPFWLRSHGLSGRIVLSLSQNAFGVYMVHLLALRILYWALPDGMPSWAGMVAVNPLTAVLLSWLACLLVGLAGPFRRILLLRRGQAADRSRRYGLHVRA
jgi:surface polysaccharide O-acyltransferase-like enzyme